MWGALLIMFGLVVIFLTRPNQKHPFYRKRFVTKLWDLLNKNFRRIVLNQSTTVSSVDSSDSRISPITEQASIYSLEKALSVTTRSPHSRFPKNPTTQLQTKEILDTDELDVRNDVSETDSLKSLVVNSDQQQLEKSQDGNEHKNSISALIQSLMANKAKICPSNKISQHVSFLNDQYVEEIDSPTSNLVEETLNILAISPIRIDSEKSNLDDNIIDVDTTYQPIDYSTVSVLDIESVPHWSHTYIYSYNDLDRASAEQREFYEKVKVKFLNKEWVDLAGNTNYAFILLFDLLEEFKIHDDIKLLEEQINLISTSYPRTAPYARRFLIEKMREKGDQEGVDRLEWSVVNHYQTDYQSWDWKNRYIKKLSLNKTDAQLLDDVYTYSTNFMNVEFCATEVVKLFISVRKKLLSAYKANNLDQNTQFKIVLDIVARKQYNYRYNSQNYQYVLANNTSLILNFILKYCENKVRELFKYNRKSTFLQGYHPDVISATNVNIFTYIEDQVDLLLNHLAKPDEATEILLNSIANTRWKINFNLSESHYQEVGKEAFLSEVNEIIRLNSKNPSLELIYLEVAKILVNCDKQLSFEYFLRYTSQNLISARLVLKLMSQTMVKKLFPIPDQRVKYYSISTALIKKELKIDQALEEIKDFYLPVRKKIILNTQTIKMVEEQHSDTVEILSEYLKDEDTLEASSIVLNSVQTDPADIIPPKNLDNNFYKFKITSQEDALITLFKNNDFELSTSQIDSFCKNIGSMKGTLINNLNESCYELIDDLLIEQESDGYKLDKTYYDQIITI